ncbi:response regulator transcription factor [Salinispora pacifica]|uniref:response regulator transcription factor n=1 Tax=Salinispora pacifica TaxID=351187 RepID=UPI0004875D1A|nr:response regulator transcription factor [Salinispora pacifica]
MTLAEDSALLREGLVSILGRFGHDIVDAVADADSLTEVVQARRPDLIITDVRMPPGNANDGLRAAVRLRQRLPRLPVLVLSQYVDQSYAAQLLDSDDGAGVGYLLKDRVGAVAEFNTAVEQVAAGATVIDPEVVRQLMRRRSDPRRRLTARELEVLALMAQGRSNDMIGRQLHVTDAAVNKHIGNIFSKLDLPVATDGHRRVLAVLAYLRS